MKNYITAAALSLAAAGSALLPGTAHAAEPTFQNSCRNIRLNTSDDSVWISAQCETRNGSWKNTTYGLYGIMNDDGFLRENDEPVSFQHSCRDAILQWTHDAVRIRAYCETMSGDERETTFDLWDIHNSDGTIIG